MNEVPAERPHTAPPRHRHDPTTSVIAPVKKHRIALAGNDAPTTLSMNLGKEAWVQGQVCTWTGSL